MSWCWSRSSSTACSSVHVRVSIERISLHSPVTGQMEIHRLTATEGACSMTKRASAGMQYCYDVSLMCSVYVATRCRSVAHYTAERNVVNSTSVYWHASLYDSCYSSMLLLLLLLLPMLFSIQVIAERERERVVQLRLQAFIDSNSSSLKSLLYQTCNFNNRQLSIFLPIASLLQTTVLRGIGPCMIGLP